MPFGVGTILKIKTSSLTDIADTREVLLICLSDQISKFRLHSAPFLEPALNITPDPKICAEGL